jgi:dolichol-phosphate mannosyltransferase
MHRFMPSLVARHGGFVIGADVAHRERLRGTSKYRVLDRLLVGISDVFGVMWLLRRGPQQGLVSEIGTTAARTENGRKDAAR